MNITGISPSLVPGITEISKTVNPAGSAQKAGETFAQALEKLNDTQANSDDLLQRFAAGEDLDIHQVMIATEETDINFRVALAIRDRLVVAYREVMRINV